MIVANHVSWSDILALASRETPCFVAKSEVAGWPLLGAFARVQDTIFVRRDSRADVPRVNAAMAGKMMAGEDVLLFGEGTSSDGGRRSFFQTLAFCRRPRRVAAFSPGRGGDVQPAAIVYTHAQGKALDAEGRRRLAWFGDADLAPHIWLLLKSAPVDCVIRFGAPLSFTHRQRAQGDCPGNREARARIGRRRWPPTWRLKTKFLRVAYRTAQNRLSSLVNPRSSRRDIFYFDT